MADQVAHLAHLNARDTTLAFVSRAPQPDIERWKARMGWEIPWYTLTDDFDADFGVDEWHGTNAFVRDDDDRIFRTYFVNKRGDEAMGSTWSYLDITALGRQEEWEDSPEGYPQTPPYAWWNLHDEYDEATVFEAASRAPPPPSAARGVGHVIVIAHVGGVPLEELLPALGGAGASLLLARAWLALHLRRRPWKLTMMLLEAQTAVIYAAGGAIGGAVARAFAREGAGLFLTGRNVAKVDAVAKEVVAAGGVAETAQVDALDERAVEDHLNTVVERAGGVDISFNAIGPGPAPHRIPLTALAGDAFARPIAFYTGSNFITATAAARHMSRQGSGVIVTLTAVPGRMPANLIGGSAPAWAAVEALALLALEVGPAGVRVVCLRSHAIPETPLIEENYATAGPAAGVTPAQFQARLEQRTLLKRLPTLAEVADTAAFIASDRAGAMTATVVNLSAGSIVD